MTMQKRHLCTLVRACVCVGGGGGAGGWTAVCSTNLRRLRHHHSKCNASKHKTFV